MSNWSYVALAFTVVWGSLAVYALVLARRVAQARQVARKLADTRQTDQAGPEQDTMLCDTPPAP